MQARQMRLLREKHSVSLIELSRHCDISIQRLSQIELWKKPLNIHTAERIEAAFNGLIAERRRSLIALESDFKKHRKHLLDFVEVEHI